MKGNWTSDQPLSSLACRLQGGQWPTWPGPPKFPKNTHFLCCKCQCLIIDVLNLFDWSPLSPSQDLGRASCLSLALEVLAHLGHAEVACDAASCAVAPHVLLEEALLELGPAAVRTRRARVFAFLHMTLSSEQHSPLNNALIRRPQKSDKQRSLVLCFAPWVGLTRLGDCVVAMRL